MMLLSSLFTGLFQGAGGGSGPWWVLGWLIAAGLIAFLISWLMQRESGDAAAMPTAANATAQAASPVMEAEAENMAGDVAPVIAEPPVEAVASAEAAVISEAEEETPAQPDDLTRIEGVGPKVSEILKDNGIVTYAQLAKADVDKLSEILEAAKLPMLHPDSWPEQARLAAARDWDKLSTLQAELSGGRRAG